MAYSGSDLPKLTEGYVGPQGKFFPYGLTTLTHPDPIIRLDTNKVEVVIGMSEPTRFTTKFKQVEPKREANECVFTQIQGMEAHFMIACSQPGFYKFEIYALPSSEAGPNMINVYNYVLEVKRVDTYVEPYPKQYPIWKQQGCFLFEPMMLQKGSNFPVKFRYFIPKAMDVQVKVGEDWNQLEQVEPNIYESVIDFNSGYSAGTKVKLNVKFGRSHKYDTLLEYTI